MPSGTNGTQNVLALCLAQKGTQPFKNVRGDATTPPESDVPQTLKKHVLAMKRRAIRCREALCFQPR
jgi:hypothetical protein